MLLLILPICHEFDENFQKIKLSLSCRKVWPSINVSKFGRMGKFISAQLQVSRVSVVFTVRGVGSFEKLGGHALRGTFKKKKGT
jgi:hypothetical protein